MLRVATWNVNGVRARETQLVEWLLRDDPSVVCLQEIKSPVAKVPASLCSLPDYWCRWHGETAYSGVALHVRREDFPGEPAFAHPKFDFENRIVTVELGRVVVASVYVPNGGKDFAAKMRFLGEMEEWVADLHAKGRLLVVCGDLNVALEERDVHPKLRKEGTIGQLPDERRLLARILERGLVDLGRRFHPEDDALFTWWPPWRNLRDRNVGWRLDYVLASEELAMRAVSCEVLPGVGTSDHAPVVAAFDAF
jgi:exodeoxyribonuclease III